MAEVKSQVAAAIVRARENLEQALCELERVPAFDPGAVPFAAHALNNYLTVTEGTIALLRSALTGHPDPQVEGWLAGLQHATTLMTHTVSRMTNAALPQAAALRFEPVELAVLAERVCEYYRPLAERKAVRLSCSGAGRGTQVWTDRVAVAAVLDNLLSNALKYSPPGKRVSVQVQGDATSVICSVEDEGPGLSAEEQARLFQRGVRLGPVPTAGEPSSGYGLAVAKELVEQLGGTISCDSAQGRGSRFSFRLPAQDGAR
jgi:signal transduction histidine kinase